MMLQYELNQWAEETFGKVDCLGLAIRGNKEMAELIQQIKTAPEKRKIVEECADVVFFLMQICEQCDADLIMAVRDKLEINRNRNWEKAPDGSFQHR